MKSRERLTSSLSLLKMNITAYTLDLEQTVFVELFCTPKSSMENPSLRVSGHGGSTNRVTKAILMTRSPLSGRGTIMCMHGNPQKFRTAKLKEEKLNAKVLAKAELVSKELARHTLVKNRHKTLNWWSEEDCIWWSKGKKGRKGCWNGKTTSLKAISIPTIQRKAQEGKGMEGALTQ